MDYQWRPYVSVAERRERAARDVARLAKKGRKLSPVAIEGRKIARSYWGEAWCDNLERYSDYENRMPRGKTYVRNGSVLDLQISAGKVAALVNGSELYEVKVDIARLQPKKWKALVRECAGQIGSLVELLQGRFSAGVMAILARPKTGLFPSPGEIQFSCTCPDWAMLCKHAAAALYGVGARLDHDPAIFFALRQVAGDELVSAAGRDLARARVGQKKRLARQDLGALFDIDLDE